MPSITLRIYIDDIGKYGKRPVVEAVQTDKLGNAEITLTTDDLIINAKHLNHLQSGSTYTKGGQTENG